MRAAAAVKARVGRPVLLNLRPLRDRRRDERGRCGVCGARFDLRVQLLGHPRRPARRLGRPGGVARVRAPGEHVLPSLLRELAGAAHRRGPARALRARARPSRSSSTTRASGASTWPRSTRSARWDRFTRFFAAAATGLLRVPRPGPARRDDRRGAQRGHLRAHLSRRELRPGALVRHAGARAGLPRRASRDASRAAPRRPSRLHRTGSLPGRRPRPGPASATRASSSTSCRRLPRARRGAFRLVPVGDDC